MSEFYPKSLLHLRSHYTLSLFKKDLFAGITVGLIALPLSMAYAIASGATPEMGLITAIIAGFLISLFGGSSVLIAGPTAIFVVLIDKILRTRGYEGLAASTLIGALLLILFGLLRLGSIIKYVPNALLTGFTTAVSLIILSTQVKDFFGLKIEKLPLNFFDKWEVYSNTFSTLDLVTTLLASATLLFILFLRKYYPQIPWGIGGIGLSALGAYFFDLKVETIASKFGELPNHLPLPKLPLFPFVLSNDAILDGVAIALLGGTESLLSAVIGDGMTGGRHQSNMELIAQGIGNLGSVLFGGIPATGTLCRTTANIKAGAETPVSGMIHSCTLLFILVFFSSLVSGIPLCALAAILIVVASTIADPRHFFSTLKGPKSDALILLTTFFLTLFVDVTLAIILGMILSCFIFFKRMVNLSKEISLKTLFEDARIREGIVFEKLPKGVEVYEIQGPFFFGAADVLKELITQVEKMPKVFILRLTTPFIDASGMNALKEFKESCHKNGSKLILCEVNDTVAKTLEPLLIESYLTLEEALSKAKETD